MARGALRVLVQSPVDYGAPGWTAAADRGQTGANRTPFAEIGATSMNRPAEEVPMLPPTVTCLVIGTCHPEKDGANLALVRGKLAHTRRRDSG